MNSTMQSATGETSVSNNSAAPKLSKLLFKGPIALAVFLAIGFGLGVLLGSMFFGKAGSPQNVVSGNKVFSGPIENFARVDGTLVAKDSGSITLEKGGSQLVIAVENNTQVVDQASTNNIPTVKNIADVEIGIVLNGSVFLTPEFLAGDENAKVRGTAFLVSR